MKTSARFRMTLEVLIKLAAMAVLARVLMPAVGPALLVFAFVFGRSAAWNACMHVACAAAAIWILVGSSLQVPMVRVRSAISDNRRTQ